MSEEKINVTFRLSLTTARRLQLLAAACGVPRVAVVMAAVRRFYVTQFGSAELPTVEQQNKLLEVARLSIRLEPKPDSAARVAFQKARHRRVGSVPGKFVKVVEEAVEAGEFVGETPVVEEASEEVAAP